MTEEESIEIFKNWLEYNKKHKNILIEADKIIAVQETILNLIQKLQEENLDVKKELEKKDIIIDFIKEEREHIKSNLETDLNRKGIYSQSKGQIQQILEYYKNNDKKINIILKKKVM